LLDLDLNPDPGTLRRFGILACVIFGLFGAMAHREVFVAAALVVIGVLSGLFALIAPRANRPLFVGLSLATFPVGFIVSHLLLALLFFGVIAPIALGMRLGGRDALRRRGQPFAESYWVRVRRSRRMRDYFRQY
jgi:uncharacterized protein YjeT (DUF2065 family)